MRIFCAGTAGNLDAPIVEKRASRPHRGQRLAWRVFELGLAQPPYPKTGLSTILVKLRRQSRGHRASRARETDSKASAAGL